MDLGSRSVFVEVHWGLFGTNQLLRQFEVTMDDLSSPMVIHPWGLSALWEAGEPPERLLLVLLAVMSLATWYLILTKLYEQYKWMRACRRLAQGFTDGASAKELMRQLSQEEISRGLVEAGSRAASEYKDRIAERVDAQTWISGTLARAVDRDQVRIRKGLPLLLTLALAAPVVGLLGTVIALSTGLTEYAELTAVFHVPKWTQPYEQRHTEEGVTKGAVGDEPSNAGVPSGAGAASDGRATSQAGAEEAAHAQNRRDELELISEHYVQKHAGMLFGILGEGLLFLMLGLTVAAPAIMGYRWLLARSKIIEQTLRDFADELTFGLLSGPLPPPAGGAGPAMASDIPVPAT
jgi:biopolymer transport protein ExbB/TolQ